jgi:hypothetical protein
MSVISVHVRSPQTSLKKANALALRAGDLWLEMDPTLFEEVVDERISLGQGTDYRFRLLEHLNGPGENQKDSVPLTYVGSTEDSIPKHILCNVAKLRLGVTKPPGMLDDGTRIKRDYTHFVDVHWTQLVLVEEILHVRDKLVQGQPRVL